MKTMETTEEVSSHRVEKRVERRNWQQIDPCAREKPRADWKKDLQTCGEWRGKRITKKAHAGRGQETKWEISIKAKLPTFESLMEAIVEDEREAEISRKKRADEFEAAKLAKENLKPC